MSLEFIASEKNGDALRTVAIGNFAAGQVKSEAFS